MAGIAEVQAIDGTFGLLDMSLPIGYCLCPTTIIISPFNRNFYSSLMNADLNGRLSAVKKSCVSQPICGGRLKPGTTFCRVLEF